MREKPVCTIRFCKRSPASWILAGYRLLEEKGLLRIGRVECYDSFLKDGLYPHNNIIEVRFGEKVIVYDYENGYQSFLRPALFDEQLECVDSYFKVNCNLGYYEGLKNAHKVKPFIAGTFSATYPKNPYDRIKPKEKMRSFADVKGAVYNRLNAGNYVRDNDFRRYENECSHFDSYNVLFWTRINETKLDEGFAKRTYPFLSDTEAVQIQASWEEMLESINQQRIKLVRLLRRELGDRLIGGIADGEVAQKLCPELITQDPRVVTRESYMATMHGNIIGLTTQGHQHCIGARFGELLASNRAIVTDPLYYTLPHAKANTNYMECASNEDICETLIHMLDNVSAIHTMEEQNRAYYYAHFRPDAAVADSLRTAGILPEQNG